MAPHRPRDVFCVIDDQYRNVDRAVEVAGGRFDLAGQAVQLGLPPDWLGGPFPDDDEWRIELSKFYHGLDLAHAHGRTGDRRFAAAWIALVESWIDQVPVDHDPTDVVARRIQNWTYAWSRFTRAGGDAILTDAQSTAVLASIADQAAHLRANLAAERNHRTLELYALVVTALAHPPIDRSGELAREALFELYRNLRADVLADGVHRERSTHYHAVALRSYLGARVNAHRFGLTLPSGYDDRLGVACEFLAAVLRPDGSLPMLSDADDGDHRGLLALAADLLDRDDLRWVASGGRAGRPPARRHHSFPDGGYHVLRSGWGDGERPFADEQHLVLDCGPVGESGHGQYDALHIEVSAGGRPLLVDPGRYTYHEDGDVNWRRWFKGTRAHNTVCVDGLDQVPYRRGKEKGPTLQARFLGCDTTPGVTSLTGEVVSPCYDAIHRRRVSFVDDEWWLVDDWLDAMARHHYDLRFHLHPDDLGRVEVAAGEIRTPALTLSVLAPERVTIVVEDGWVAWEYGRRVPAPVVSISTVATSTRFTTAVRPAVHSSAPSGASPLAGSAASVAEASRW